MINPLLHFPSINELMIVTDQLVLTCNEVYVICCIVNLEGIANDQKSFGIEWKEKAHRVC